MGDNSKQRGSDRRFAGRRSKRRHGSPTIDDSTGLSDDSEDSDTASVPNAEESATELNDVRPGDDSDSLGEDTAAGRDAVDADGGDNPGDDSEAAGDGEADEGGDDSTSDPIDMDAQAAITVELDPVSTMKLEADRALLSKIGLGDLNLAESSSPSSGAGTENHIEQNLERASAASDVEGIMDFAGAHDDLPPGYRALVSSPVPKGNGGAVDAPALFDDHDGSSATGAGVPAPVATEDEIVDTEDGNRNVDSEDGNVDTEDAIVDIGNGMGSKPAAAEVVPAAMGPRRTPSHSIITTGAVVSSGTDGPLQRSFLRHPWLLVLAGLLPVLATTGWVLTRTPTHTATARLLIEPIEDDSYLRSLPLLRRFGEPTRTVQTAAALIDTRDIAARAASAAGSDLTTDDVADNIVIALEGQTNVIGITASAPTPTEAIALANAYADAALATREELLQEVVDAEIVELERRLDAIPSTDGDQRVGIEEILSELRLIRSDPTMSLAERASEAEPYGQTSNIVTVLASLILGVAATIALAVYLDWRINDRVRTIGEVELTTGLPVLGEIPGRFRALLPGKRVGMSDDTTFRVLRHRLSALHAEAEGLTFSSLSAPEDSCYVVANVGSDLAQTGRATVVLNYDPAANWRFKRSRRTRRTESRLAPVDDQVLEAAPFDDHVLLLDASRLEEGPLDHDPLSVLEDLTAPDRLVLVNVPSLITGDLAIEASHHAPAVLVVRLLETPLKSLSLVSQLVKYDQMDVLGIVVINSALRAG